MMFIAKFNALIRNRLFWGAFAFLVVISFVGWGTQSVGPREETRKIGELEDGEVRAEDFQEAWFNAYVATSLMFGRPMTVNPRTDQALKKLAWRRLAAARQARAAGWSVTDAEVAALIQQQPQFQNEGRFDPARYQAFLQNFLGGMSLSPVQFERYLKNEILLNKARQMLSPQAWVAPLEVEQVFHQLYDELKVSYAILSQSNLNYAVDVSAKEARAYFDAHREEFMIPEKVRVRYAVIPMEPAAGGLDDAALKEYYDEHIEDFTVRDTNDWTNAEPFENVREQIRRTLTRQRADEAAAERAAEFEVALAPDRQGQALAFDEAAAKAGLEVRITDYFAEDELLPEPPAGLEFNRAAFELRKTPEEYFSRPVKGADAYYVLALDDRRDARLPEYEEARAAVFPAARSQAMADELRRLAVEILEAARAARAAGRPLAPVFAGYGVELCEPEAFVLQTGLEGVLQDEGEDFQLILREIMKGEPGKLTDLVEIPDGYAIGCLEERRPADPALLASIRSELTGYIRKRRDELVFNEWQNFLVDKAEIHNLKSDAEMAELEAQESGEADVDEEETDDAAEASPAGEEAAPPAETATKPQLPDAEEQ